MKNQHRRVVSVIAGIALALAATSIAQANTPEPSAAAASVLPSLTIEPVRPYRPGDQVWLSAPPVAHVSAISSTSGCQRVPSTGYIGTNVYADSTSESANYWSWGSASSGQPFYWYVKRADNTNADSGYSAGGGGSSSITASTYHWKVQNKGSTPQAWNVCWDMF